MKTDNIDYKKIKIIIERLIPFEELVDVSFGNVFCPFHNNKITKAAKFYLDDDNVVRLYCFSEHRTYTSFDYLKLIKNVNPLDYLKSRYSEKELDKLVEILEHNNCFSSLSDTEVLDSISNRWVDSEENLNVFLDDIYSGYHLEEFDNVNSK